MTDTEVIELLAGGAVLKCDDTNGAAVVTRHGTISAEQWNRLAAEGWLDSFANGGGARLSDAGRLAYIRSTDEMGDGTLAIPDCGEYGHPHACGNTACLRAAMSSAGQQSQAASDVLAERRRQIEREGWTPEHDDEHAEGEMANAAACYALHTEPVGNVGDYLRFWPWDSEWWKPKDRRSNMVRAAALLLAEIERLDRVAG